MIGRFQANLLERKEFDRPKGFKHYLSQKDLKFIKDSFKMNDNNKTSEIDIDELRQALDKYGIEFNDDENFKQLFDETEKNGKTSIDFDEFINLVTSRMADIDSMNELQKVFCLFLGDENVDKIEYRHIKRECPELSDDEIIEMISKVDEDKDGKVTFEEFYKIVTKLI